MMSRANSRQRADLGTPIRESVDEQVFDDAIGRIVEVARPQRIVLFGSAALGHWTATSDLDLLVIAETENPRALAREIHDRLRGVGMPIDALVATPAHVRRYRNTNGLIYKPAIEEGVIVYEAGRGDARPSRLIPPPSEMGTGYPTPEILDEVVRRITEVLEPERIIMFGPAARDQLLPGRDVPLLIIAAVEDVKLATGRVYASLYGVGVGVTAIVSTPSHVASLRHADGSVFKHALDDGTVLYAA